MTSALEQDTPLSGAMTILIGLEASPYPLGATMSCGARHATELATPPIHAMPPPSKYSNCLQVHYHSKAKEKLREIKASRAIANGKARTFLQHINPNKQRQLST